MAMVPRSSMGIRPDSSIMRLGPTAGRTMPQRDVWEDPRHCFPAHGVAGRRCSRVYARQSRRQLRRLRIDTYVGMGVSNLVAYFMIVATAATLHAKGIT